MAWCPECKSQYEDSVSQCAECGVPLVAEIPAESPHEEATEPTAVAYVTQDEVEAEAISEILNESGISNSLVSDLTQSVFPITVNKLARVRVQVMQSDLEAAQRKIAEFKSGTSDD